MNLETKSNKSILQNFMRHHYEWIEKLPLNDQWHLGATDEHLWFRMTPVTDREPFGCGKSFHCIAINTDLCKDYNLTDEEIEAMLCHEIGHIVNEVKQGDKEEIRHYWLRKELEADRLVVEHGMQDALLSGLRKLINTEVFKDALSQMKARIHYWESK